jgi:hypothetical protein
MTAAAAYEPPEKPQATPKAIRDALLPEEVEAFDRDYRRALTIAQDTLHLDELRTTLQHWHRNALATHADPVGRRHMLACIRETLASGGAPQPGSVSLSDLKAEFGL